MLVLTRKIDEQITIGDSVNMVVLSIHSNRVRLGISAPQDVAIARLPAAAPLARVGEGAGPAAPRTLGE